MKTILLTLSVIGLAIVATTRADATDASVDKDEIVQRMSRSAQDELARSVQELTALRDQIASEKVPMAERLTAQEERLAQLRRDYERIMRHVDAGNMEMVTIKAQIKAQQDEATYIGNLLDEYVRSSETRLHVSELQYCGTDIQRAKEARDDNSLSVADKFSRQLAFVNVSLRRLTDAIGGMRFDGVAVNLQGTVAQGTYALIGPVALFRSRDGLTAGLAIPQSGSSNPLVRPLDAVLNASLAAVVEKGEGLFPLDPSRGGALKALVQKTSLIHIFKKGGPIMWPLLIASILALGTVFERVFFLTMERGRRSLKKQVEFFEAVGKGELERAIRISNVTKDYVVRTLGYALVHREKSLANALLYAQEQEIKRFRRGIPILDTVITLAPLLGLLGTVVGMMGSFSLIGGELSSPGAITGGIAEALIATAFGLGIAITCLIPFNILNTRMEHARHELEAASTQLELMVHPPASIVAAVAHAQHPQEPIASGVN